LREKHNTYVDSDNQARIDIRFKIEKGKILFFSINLSLLAENKVVDVYRCDTAHGYPHEQKFWRSFKPIKIKNGNDYKKIFHEKYDEVKKNYKKYIKWFKDAKEK